ncbi:TRAP-type C4-dicarboxylate transport system, periplasmic component [Marinobacterium lacunae]|uniref:TRAP-type C4-dicarboxylate transport system, periplasmic component n=1 Tax=Marinobacterium lacunae TaxID=1232683 RepID=A0A081G3G3_9GAMM|nr:TRAP transporter substrate-binding protein [Marinobacterium lacunae]KEA65318.1 TRAP-type C4-dicarboxylate transport system, periplasmic component [Marinobacterium lacunae]
MSIMKRVASILTVGVALAVAPVQAKEFKLGLITPPSHDWTKAAYAFADEVKAKSDGEHSVAVYPARQLGNEAEMVQQLQTGALDMAFLTVAEISNRVPDFGALYAPYLVDNIDQAASLLKSDAARSLLDQLPAEVGLVGIGYGMAGMRQVLSRDTAAGPADLSGRKLRITPFEPIRDFYLDVGAAPVPLPLPEVYDALANGQIDAIDMDFDSMLIFKFYERADNLLISNHMMFPMVGVVSGRVWKGLTPAERELLQTSMREQLDAVIDHFQAKEKDQEKQLRAQNIKIREAGEQDFAEAINQWEATWSEKAKSLGKLRQAAAEIKGS